MSRGRKAKPTKMKLLDGNPGNRPINQRDAANKVEIPCEPDNLPPYARTEWKRVTRLLGRARFITLHDRTILSAYCLAWSNMMESQKIINSRGIVIERSDGKIIKNPACTVVNDSMSQIRAFCAEFGLSPSARSKMSMEPLTDENEADGIDEFARKIG